MCYKLTYFFQNNRHTHHACTPCSVLNYNQNKLSFKTRDGRGFKQLTCVAVKNKTFGFGPTPSLRLLSKLWT